MSVGAGGGGTCGETGLWNVAENRSESMRSKECAHDYRYSPDPELLPVHVSTGWLAEIQREKPESPADSRKRFEQEHGLSDYDAGGLTATRELGDYFEAVIRAGGASKASASWIQTELLRRLNDSGRPVEKSPVTPAALAGLLAQIETGNITGASGKKVLDRKSVV